jgi:hypothetical protein
MKPLEGLTVFGRKVLGWLPNEPVAADLHGMPRPWWWQPTWSLGAFVAEVAVLNLVVPVSALSLPLFLANMWLCFLAGGVAGHWMGKKMGYQPSPAPGYGWDRNPRWFITLPLAAEFGVGVAYFSVSNWVYVFTNCQTGNVCTLSQLAPVMLLLLGAIGLAILGVNALRLRIRKRENVLVDQLVQEQMA